MRQSKTRLILSLASILLLSSEGRADILPGNSIAKPFASTAYSNGCGGEGPLSTLIPNTFAIGSSTRPSFTFIINITPACDIHDAGYSGGIVYDTINNKIKDYSKSSRKSIDDDILANIEKICTTSIKNDQGVVAICFNMARTYYVAIRNFGQRYFDAEPSKPGRQDKGSRNNL